MNSLDSLWDIPAPHTFATRVAAADIDGLNHTNNAVYVNWCQQVAWAHSVALGLDLGRYRELDRAMAITRSEYDYLQASREGDEVVVGTWIVGWDRKLTMERRFQVIRPADGATLLSVVPTMLSALLETGRELPRRIRGNPSPNAPRIERRPL